MSTAEVEPDVPAPARPRRPTPARWRWSNWSLTHRLPVLAAGIVVLVVAVSLALTYGALKRARIDETYERL
ncbi:MAG TPA: hypothetical protein VFI52_09725, partial [Gemmatimonadaceae bacterium]|nr:hypothetical protein [Gemmatimonadaceae bacterium]